MKTSPRRKTRTSTSAGRSCSRTNRSAADAEPQGDRADVDGRAGRQALLLHRLAVHARAVGAAEVDEQEAVPVAAHLGVVAGDRVVLKHQVVVARATDARGGRSERDAP